MQSDDATDRSPNPTGYGTFRNFHPTKSGGMKSLILHLLRPQLAARGVGGRDEVAFCRLDIAGGDHPQASEEYEGANWKEIQPTWKVLFSIDLTACSGDGLILSLHKTVETSCGVRGILGYSSALDHTLPDAIVACQAPWRCLIRRQPRTGKKRANQKRSRLFCG